MTMGFKGKYFSVSFRGGPELLQALKALPYDVRKKALISGMKKGARIVRDEAVREAPRGEKGGLAEKNSWLIRYVRLKPQHKRLHIVVKPRYGIKNLPQGAKVIRHFHLIEFGTKPHTITTRNIKGIWKIMGGKKIMAARVLSNPKTRTIYGRVVRHPGSRANPFFRRAKERSRERAVEAVRSQVQNYLSRGEWRRAK